MHGCISVANWLHDKELIYINFLFTCQERRCILIDKNDLLDITGDLYLLLNGKTLKGERATYASYFVVLRYIVILLAAITLDIVKNDDEDKDLRQNCTRLNYYELKKVADLLHLDFDRTRSAKRIYTELKDKGLVEIRREGDREYICLTDKGREKCERKIEETRKLMKYFRSIPMLQVKYSEQQTSVIGLKAGDDVGDYRWYKKKEFVEALLLERDITTTMIDYLLKDKDLVEKKRRYGREYFRWTAEGRYALRDKLWKRDIENEFKDTLESLASESLIKYEEQVSDERSGTLTEGQYEKKAAENLFRCERCNQRFKKKKYLIEHKNEVHWDLRSSDQGIGITGQDLPPRWSNDEENSESGSRDLSPSTGQSGTISKSVRQKIDQTAESYVEFLINKISEWE